MPSSDSIRAGLTAIANDWRWLAVTWHLMLFGLLLPLFAGWRPSSRVVAQLLDDPRSLSECRRLDIGQSVQRGCVRCPGSPSLPARRSASVKRVSSWRDNGLSQVPRLWPSVPRTRTS